MSDNIEMSDEQNEAIRAIEAGENVLVTGPAGTGKSELIKYLRKKYPDLPVTASTGIAGVAVGGATLHSWAGIGLGQDPAATIANRIYYSRDRSPTYTRITTSKKLVIDEISMVGASTFSLVDQVFRRVRNSQQPFGGIQLILFGDFLQLPPVEDYSADSGARFAFETDAWKDMGIRKIVLTKVFRQSEEGFIRALHEARMGFLSRESAALLQGRFRLPDEDPEKPAVRLFSVNIDVDAYNNQKLDEVPGEDDTYTSTDWCEDSALGKSSLSNLVKNCPAPSLLRLKKGARVMLLKNIDLSSGLANGSLGTVLYLFPGRVAVRFDNGEDRILETSSWEIMVGDSPIAIRRQIPLRLAYAITIHKSQGMSLDKARVSLREAFECGQAYVALGRVRTLGGLYIEDGGGKSIFAHPSAMAFYSEK